MERLISSSTSLSSGASISKHRFLVPGSSSSAYLAGISKARSGLLFLRRSGFKPVGAVLSNYDEPHRPRVFHSLSCLGNSAVQILEGKGGQNSLDAQSETGRDLTGVFLRKVASTAFSVLLSVVTVTVIQTILARPVYATVQAAAQTGGRLFRTEFLGSAWTGFFAGCLHTLSGPDHLAALAPLSIGRTRIESAIVGALWGCGHDAGQMIFGLLFLLLKDRLRIEVIRTWGTRVVGITLLIIGAMGIKEASEVATPCVAHENGECDVSIVETLESTSSARKKMGFATFATGIVHGLQPDALMMILPALALPSRLAGAAFLGMFLVGTVFAMGTYTVFIGSCSQALKGRVPRITEKLTWAASLLAIFMGLAILISQLFELHIRITPLEIYAQEISFRDLFQAAFLVFHDLLAFNYWKNHIQAICSGQVNQLSKLFVLCFMIWNIEQVIPERLLFIFVFDLIEAALNKP
ncbi:hypothetical protein IEQ34_015062 [Dendrobium chrysotoxum]|uniref:Urease accessory protein UreH-like transmembrane domain-containing protein n=1 Tax=Dendrobium chrysotoxum TaxID=161865 RepID=A0AAV7G5L8_DENCH|nr:hypothetical protein IEQ34_015062 [Dendrobium chrysotoxum]